ncbi:tRNA(Met) cytidine acetyltransferase TmcA domain-containing protein [Pseudoalteromonas sp. G4]|uniref:tRNA(Met) cytidine acetyltransferase TmcA domain-containing protein n=1 Tax=Pseudoalteromonas sp. G4 TaxID=2992761 RepID=UPI00237E450A|nr:tRNA(Met) cytidine acetyltransferase TmcA domain-containing protein [Pseudoalteromonas sp. G4]MDE3273607.1 TmcA N-terminal domain-containing protein [Pseudoalteromonas sp. G4]
MSKHRQLLVLSGSEHWCWQQVDSLKTVYPDLLTLSNHPSVNFWPEHNHQLLGQEYSTVVFDVNSGLMPDKLATVAGTVKAGGLLVLLMPNFESYTKQADPVFARFQSANKPHQPISLFQTRLISQLKNNEQALIVSEHHARPTIPMYAATESTQYQEQQNLVADLSKFLTKPPIEAGENLQHSACLPQIMFRKVSAWQFVPIISRLLPLYINISSN